MLKSPRLGLHSKAGRRASAGRALQHSDSYLGAIASCNVGFISRLGSVDVVINVYTAPTLLHQSRIVLIFTNLSLSSLERLILVTLSHLRSSSLSFKVRFLLYSAEYLTAFFRAGLASRRVDRACGSRSRATERGKWSCVLCIATACDIRADMSTLISVKRPKTLYSNPP